MATFTIPESASYAFTEATLGINYVEGFLNVFTGGNGLIGLENCYTGGEKLIEDFREILIDVENGDIVKGIADFGSIVNEF